MVASADIGIVVLAPVQRVFCLRAKQNIVTQIAIDDVLARVWPLRVSLPSSPKMVSFTLVPSIVSLPVYQLIVAILLTSVV